MAVDLSLPGVSADDRAELAAGIMACVDWSAAGGPAVDAFRALSVALAGGRRSAVLSLDTRNESALVLLLNRVSNYPSRYGPPAAALERLMAAVQTARTA